MKKDPSRTLPAPLKQALGATIRKLRKQQNIGLVDFSVDTFTDAGNISRIERAKQLPTLEMLYVISRALGTKMWEILQLAETGGLSDAPLAPSARRIALAWERLPQPVRLEIENRIAESLTLLRRVPTYYKGQQKPFNTGRNRA